MDVLSLFTGAGGLDLGLEAAGFSIAGCLELDPDCQATLRANTDWRLASSGDVETSDPAACLREFGLKQGEVGLLAGGPPCQPFSKSGQWVNGAPARMKHRYAGTWSAVFRFLEAGLPQVLLLENVRGLATQPKLGPRDPQPIELLQESLNAINHRHGTKYQLSTFHLDAADIGVPQKRERTFLIAERDGLEMAPPRPTHGPRAAKGSPRYSTTWDAIGDLDGQHRDVALSPTGKWAALLPTIPEGQNYLYHTPRGEGEPLFGWRSRYWSFLLKLAKDLPSWTLQAQAGPATGPFHWKNRRLSARELARLQAFPDSHKFAGSPTSVRRQIGNAVPVSMGEAIGLEIRRQFLREDHLPGVSSIPVHRDDCPPREEVLPVPDKYLPLRADHPDHPGPGEGPRAVSLRQPTG